MMESKDIVRAAWEVSGLSQVKFARLLNKSQPMLSKYMSGAAIPPSDVIILCMNKFGLLQQSDIPAAVLAERIVRELSGAAFASTRTAIGHILDSISRGNDTIALRKARWANKEDHDEPVTTRAGAADACATGPHERHG